jgi:RNA polymerase sigma-70 factor (ECF subfamily)
MNREAFNDIIHEQYRRLYFIAFRILSNSQEAEDVVQDVFMKMWMMKEKLDKYNDIGALAVTITRNTSIDMLRKWKHIDNNNDNPEILSQELSQSPHDLLVNTESANILNEIIEGLPANLREIIQLREIDGLSYGEIASKTNININNLRVILSRARTIIKEKYLNYSYARGKT